MTLLTKTIPQLNMDRWYLVIVQPTLVDQWAVIVAWGNRQTNYQRARAFSAGSAEEAQALAQKITEKKLKRGYTEVKHD